MKANEIREKKDDELVVELDKYTKDLRELKFKKVTGVIENPLRIRKMRKDIARIKTILHMRKIEQLKKELENME